MLSHNNRCLSIGYIYLCMYLSGLCFSSLKELRCVVAWRCIDCFFFPLCFTCYLAFNKKILLESCRSLEGNKHSTQNETRLLFLQHAVVCLKSCSGLDFEISPFSLKWSYFNLEWFYIFEFPDVNIKMF